MQAMRTEDGGTNGGPLYKPASVLLPGMRLLAQLTSAEPGLALSLVQMQVPAGAGESADADLLTLSAAGLSLQEAAAGLSAAETLQLYGKLPQMVRQAQHDRVLACAHACAPASQLLLQSLLGCWRTCMCRRYCPLMRAFCIAQCSVPTALRFHPSLVADGTGSAALALHLSTMATVVSCTAVRMCNANSCNHKGARLLQETALRWAPRSLAICLQRCWMSSRRQNCFGRSP